MARTSAEHCGVLPHAEPYVLSGLQPSTSALTSVDPSADQVEAPILPFSDLARSH